MPRYEIRFLRKDGSYRLTVPIEAISDTEASAYVIETYPQRAIELWEGERRISRRTSPAFDLRLSGQECYPSSPRYAALLPGKDLDKLSMVAFESAGRFSNSVFNALKAHLADHRIWVRAVNHPEAPATVDQKSRVSVSVVENDAASIYGFTSCDLWSRTSDGEAVLEDCCSAIKAALAVAHQPTGATMHEPHAWPMAPDGIYTYMPININWTVPIAEDRDVAVTIATI